MQRRLLLLACALLMTVGNVCVNAQTKTSSASSQQYVEGVVRVKLQPEVASRMVAAQLPMSVKGTSKKYVQTGVTPLDKVNQKVKAVSMTRVFPYAGKDEAKHKAYGLDLWYDVRYEASDMKLAQVRNLYGSTQGVAHAQRIPVYKPIGGEKFIEVSPAAVARAAKAASTMPASQALPFNDPLLKNQWHYHNDGSISGTKAGADANVFQAWATGVTGSKDVIVAIIDGGFQVDHPDLKDNVWINEAELNGQPGVDDDGDGFVDDIYGYNFVTNSSDISAHSHGTHVAGTVGATNGNGIGVCGVAGGSDGTGGVKMMVCQVFDSRTSTSDGDFAQALVYAADRGASIAQCSWGASAADVSDESINEAVRYFTKEGGGNKMNGGLCIFASGNNGEEGNYYPGCLDEAVAVGALAADGSVAYYSNYGSWVDVTAPGGLEDNGEKYGVLSTLPNSSYGYNEGTSMACPHVSGIAALILSKYGSKDFSNETLRTLLTSSVNDLYTQNPDYKGKMGSGYIDAYKALQGKEGSSPEAVSDFTVTPSHDNALIEWTIPDCEEKSIDHHVIYYSTTSFDSTTDVSTLNRVSVDTKFKTSGDTIQYELTGLKATTTYYFAIVAYSRWGKASAMSAVKSAATNAGPKVQLDKKTLSMTVDATKSDVASASFNIKNVGEGVLKYSLTTATTKATMSTSSRQTAPTPGQVVPFNGKVRAESVKSNSLVTSDYTAEDWPDTIKYWSYVRSYIGESDTKLPNAMAQYFYVNPSTYPNGFNLTHVNFSGQNGTDPVIEIYDGARSISAASLLEKVTYSFWAYNYDISLPEQIYFAPGSSFWIVAKFPGGAKNPLATGYNSTSGMAPYSFYSSDNGNSWTQLSQVLKGSSWESVSDNLTWAVTALSKNPDWTSVLNPSPESGEVRANEQQEVTMKNDGQKLVNGTYKFNIHVKSNEATDSKSQVQLTMTVKGNKPQLHSQQLIDFGSLLVGQTKSVDVELTNSGYGVFGASYSGKVKSSSDQFQGPNYLPAISARSKSKVAITFAPTKAGDVSSTITLSDRAGNSHTFLVRGVASEPAKLSLTENEFAVGDLKVGGDEVTKTVTIKNEGKYPLQYVFPKFSSTSIEGSTARVHKFGYTLLSNVAGDTTFDYEEAPVLSDETDITSQFSSNVWQSGPIKVGFKFPFYGKDYEQIYVSSYGGVSMNAITGRISCMVPTADCVDGLGYISAYTNSGWMEMGGNTKISYGHKDGKLYIKFKDVMTPATNGGGEMTTISFHMALSPDGSVEVHYDNYTPDNVFGEGGNNFVGISDINCEDPCVFTDASKITEANGGLNGAYYDIETGSAIKIVAPAKSMIKSLSSTDGYVGNGESKDVTVTLAAGDDLNAGELTNYLTLLTNDPVNSSANIKFTANITGDNLKPEAAYDSTSVDYGKVFRTSVQNRTVLLSNNGKDVLTVTSVVAKDGKFTVADEVKDGFTVPAGQGKDIIVTLPTTESGEVSDVLVITYADGTTKEIALKGNVIGCPTWSVNPESLSAETPYGTNVKEQLTVTNKGDEPLTFALQPETWYKAGDVVADGNGKIEYEYESKSDGFDVEYDWKDITADYTEHMPYAYFADNTDYKEVTLPFEFPFYGKKYKTMYIYNTGFVSFSKTDDYKEFPEPPASLPSTETFYRNMICPFWGNHTMNTPSTDGVYYKAGEDEVIVSFKNYGNTMMSGMNFQLIMRKDGSFKFQYKLNPDGFQLGVFGLCGIMDESQTRGICPSDSYINSGNAIEFKPYKTYEIAANGEVTFPVEILANQLADEYTYELTGISNDPQHAEITIPVSLTITGEADAVFPETLNIEQPADEEAMEPSYYEFTVVNKGTKAFTITNISSPMFEPTVSDDDPWGGSPAEAELQVYLPQSNGGDIGGDDGGVVGLASDNGNKVWQSYYTDYMEPIVVGKDSLKFRLLLTNIYESHEGEYTITYNVEGLDTETKTTTVNLNITDVPYLTFEDEDGFYMDGVANEGKQTFTTKMTNGGEYKLTYSLKLDPSGHDVQTDSEYDDGGIAPAYNVVVKPEKTAAKTFVENCMSSLSTTKSALKAMGVKKVKDEQHFVWDVPSGLDYTSLLYHPILNPATSAKATIMGTGASDLDANFYAATRYEAPAEGFNLSHLYFVGTVGNLENVDIEASVILGSDVTATDKTIGHGKLHVDKEEPAPSGSYNGVARLLEFDKPVYINPADTFYVVVKYPAGYATSAVMSSKDGEMETNRYMCNLKSLGGWVDIEALYDDYYSYGAFGYFMTCVETKKGEPWIKLLNEKTEGEIAVGGSVDLNFEVNPESTYFEKNNKATLVVTSNDPTKKVYNYHLYYNKNAAPYITVPEATLTVPEASKVTAKVTVEDPDEDAFTVSIYDASGIATISSYTNGDGTQEGISMKDGVISVEAGYQLQLEVELIPDYEKAGSYNFLVTATDSKNNVRTATVNYSVEHANRAPEWVGDLDEIVLNTGETSQVYYYANLFTEPDGEDMEFQASMSDGSVASLFTSEQGFVITAGNQPGTTQILVSAIDEQAATTVKTITVTVKSPTGISGVTADGNNSDVAVNGNVGGNAEVTFSTAADKAVLLLYNNAGQLVAQKTLNGVHAGDKVELSAGHALSGVYHLVVDLDGKGSNIKFAVK